MLVATCSLHSLKHEIETTPMPVTQIFAMTLGLRGAVKGGNSGLDPSVSVFVVRALPDADVGDRL